MDNPQITVLNLGNKKEIIVYIVYLNNAEKDPHFGKQMAFLKQTVLGLAA